MKKQDPKRLNFNKVTIANLNQDELRAVAGGQAAPPPPQCSACQTQCCQNEN